MTLQKTLDLYEEYLRLQREIGRLLGKTILILRKLEAAKAVPPKAHAPMGVEGLMVKCDEQGKGEEGRSITFTWNIPGEAETSLLRRRIHDNGKRPDGIAAAAAGKDPISLLARPQLIQSYKHLYRQALDLILLAASLSVDLRCPRGEGEDSC